MYARDVILTLFLLFVALLIVLPIIGLALWALISTAIVGLIIGGLGRLLVPGHQPIGLLRTFLLGWIGAIVGGFIGQHVLHRGGFLTVLIEIGIAAVLVATVSSVESRRAVGGGRGPRGSLY
jgi:uncharacterized membrane protein YeaQ/YmgE (transglycosylase-associated protein family)